MDDLRAEELYEAQRRLIAAETAADQASFDYHVATMHVDALRAQVRRLSGGTLPQL